MTQENKEGKTVQEETAAQEPETAKASEKDASKELKKEMKKEEKELKKEKDRIEDLEKQVKELSDKVAKEKDDYIRLMAEFERKGYSGIEGLYGQYGCKGGYRADLQQAYSLSERQGSLPYRGEGSGFRHRRT